MDDTRNQFCKKPGKEPSNCIEFGPPIEVQGDPYPAAAQFINQDPAHKCCTILGHWVQRWQLKAVLKDSADSETTFFYNYTKLPLAGECD